jgi:hypothetical protein
MSAYVFILCPPFSGSTVLWKLIASSENVSSLPAEGQFLPEIKEIARRNAWNDEATQPWPWFKEIWESYWQEKPYKVEKSPPHLLRASEIEKIFIPTYFVAMIRNPYAFCEGYSRRSGQSLRTSALFWQKCARFQRFNIEQLSRILFFTYEDFTEDTTRIVKELEEFLPGVGPLKWMDNYESQSIFGPISKRISNLNDVKIGRLSSAEIDVINTILGEDKSLMDHYGYSFIYSGLQYEIWRLRANVKLKIINNWERAKRLFNRRIGSLL